jgi:hypothetical protein
MRPLGKKKTREHVKGHQDCDVCRPQQKNGKARSREEARREVSSSMKVIESSRGASKP